jgi:hypothetical protein
MAQRDDRRARASCGVGLVGATGVEQPHPR